jgi:hypothetical protein
MEEVVVDDKGNLEHNHSYAPAENRASKRRAMFGKKSETKLSKDGKVLCTPEMRAKGAFGSPKGKKGFMTKYSADQHKWVEPVKEADVVKPKKTRKKKVEE